MLVDDGSTNSPVGISLENSMPWRLSLKLGVEAPNPPTRLLPGRKSASNMAVLRSWGTPNKPH